MNGQVSIDGDSVLLTVGDDHSAVYVVIDMVPDDAEWVAMALIDAAGRIRQAALIEKQFSPVQ